MYVCYISPTATAAAMHIHAQPSRMNEGAVRLYVCVCVNNEIRNKVQSRQNPSEIWCIQIAHSFGNRS